MAHATISYTPIPENAHYTLAQINALFAALAVVINGKADTAGESLTDAVTVEGIPVVVDDVPVVVIADGLTLTDFIAMNNKTVINLGEGVEDDDAVTVEQARRILGV